MRNIAFYLANKRIANIDCRDIVNGNPGIGGTFYSMISLATSLSSICNDDYNFFLIADSRKFLPEVLNIIEINHVKEIDNILISHNIDVLVINDGGPDTFNNNFFKYLRKAERTKVVIWGHCTMSTQKLRLFNKVKQIHRIVNVSNEQLYDYCDHMAFEKSVVINNGYYFNIEQKIIPYNKRENTVVYLGGILPIKGFHILAKSWSTVVSEVPDAKLIVIGSGNLYDPSQKMGKYGIAEKFYEQSFMKYLLNNNGQILDSVTFLGTLGKEKFKYLEHAKVGVPNPGGIPETFCYTAIEMQASGMQVTSKICPGFIDTISDDGGIIYNSAKDLSNNIIRLLKTESTAQISVLNELQTKFSFDHISEKWIELFDELIKGEWNQHTYNPTFKLNLSKLKHYNRLFKRAFPFGSILPSIKFYIEICNKLKYIFIKIMDFNNTVKKVKNRLINSNHV
jgi:glycosyltransferase involved in cell wall biosynthesis